MSQQMTVGLTLNEQAIGRPPSKQQVNILAVESRGEFRRHGAQFEQLFQFPLQPRHCLARLVLWEHQLGNVTGIRSLENRLAIITDALLLKDSKKKSEC